MQLIDHPDSICNNSFFRQLDFFQLQPLLCLAQVGVLLYLSQSSGKELELLITFGAM